MTSKCDLLKNGTFILIACILLLMACAVAPVTADTCVDCTDKTYQSLSLVPDETTIRPAEHVGITIKAPYKIPFTFLDPVTHTTRTTYLTLNENHVSIILSVSPGGATITPTSVNTGTSGEATADFYSNDRGTYTISASGTFCCIGLLGRDKTKQVSGTTTITVVNNPPIITSMSVPSEGEIDDPISFSATATDADGDGLHYKWVFGGADTLYGQTVTHTFDHIGTNSVTLTVSDSYDASDFQTKSITITETGTAAGTNAKPVITTMNVPSSAEVDASVPFYGSATDADGDELTYIWDFGDGETCSGATVFHEFVSAKSYMVTLTVTDGNGGIASISKTIVINKAGTTTTTTDSCATLEKSVNPETAGQDETVGISVTIENTGTTTISSIVVSDSAPEGFDFVSGAIQSSYTSLKPGESRTILYTVRPESAGRFVLDAATASYSDQSGGSHTLTSNTPTLEVTASGSGSSSEGEEETATATPGFGVAIAVTGLAAVLLYLRYKR